MEEAEYTLSLKGKVALVTGGGRGIGKKIANDLAARGAKVGIIDRKEGRGQQAINEINNQGYTAVFEKGDVSIQPEAQTATEHLVEELGGLDILVNNAGITEKVRFKDLSLQQWENLIRNNLTGYFLSSKAALPYLLKSAEPTIVMISSMSAVTGSGGGAHYAASKGGINSLVRALAFELAPNGIRVNGVAPRTIATKGLSNLYTQEEKEMLIKQIPLGRLGKPEDVSNAVLFLATSLSSFTTGEVITVDGGRTFSKC